MAEEALCFRCDWTGDATGGCPRCGARLYRRPKPGASARREEGASTLGASSSTATLSRHPLTAAVVDPERRRPPPRRRPWLWLLAAIAVVVGALLLADPRTDERPEPPAAPALPTPTPARTRYVALPEGLSDLTARSGPHDVVFATTHPSAEGEAPRSRLWQLSLPSGTLTPGPVVGPIREIRAAPRARADRLAFTDEGGTLFVIEGNLIAGRPTWVTSGADAFDFAPDGSLVFANMEQRTAATGGVTETVMSVGRFPSGEGPALERVSRPLRSFLPRGFVVRSRSAVSWGLLGGRPVVLSLPADPDAPFKQVSTGSVHPLDISPVGLVLGRDSDRGGTVLYSPAAKRVALPVNLRVDRVLGWSRGSTAVLIGGRDGASGRMFLASFPGYRPRPLAAAGSAVAEPAHVSFSWDGHLVGWSSGQELHVADLKGGRVFRIRMPSTLPRLAGPVAIG